MIEHKEILLNSISYIAKHSMLYEIDDFHYNVVLKFGAKAITLNFKITEGKHYRVEQSNRLTNKYPGSEFILQLKFIYKGGVQGSVICYKDNKYLYSRILKTWKKKYFREVGREDIIKELYGYYILEMGKEIKDLVIVKEYGKPDRVL